MWPQCGLPDAGVQKPLPARNAPAHGGSGPASPATPLAAVRDAAQGRLMDHTAPQSGPAQPCSPPSPDAGPADPLLLLPVPNREEVADFIALYRRKYGVELDEAQASEVLGGLMRFLYLTQRHTAGGSGVDGEAQALDSSAATH